MQYHLLTFSEDWADEHDVPALACMDDDTFNKWKAQKCYPYAQLGNGGDGFMEEAQGMTGEQLLENYVGHRVVDESFKRIFDEAHLDSLSLSNIFNLGQSGTDYDGGEDDDEQDTDGD